MGNVCNAEAHQSQQDHQLAPRGVHYQREPVYVSFLPDTDATRKASQHKNSDRRVHHHATPTSSPRTPRKQCQFDAKRCFKKGEACTCIDESSKQNDEEEDSKNDETSFDFLREFGGAWVYFGRGATVTQIALPSDFSAIHISNLPTGCTARLVRDLLLEGGLTVSRNDVQFTNSVARSAVVKVRNPSFAKEACRRFPTQVPGFGVASTPVPLPVGSNFRRVECRQVQFMWYRPSREVDLVFRTRQAALRLHQKFPTGLTLRGCQATVHAPVAQGFPEEFGAWSVRLSGLDENIKGQDIPWLIAKPYRPLYVLPQGLTYVHDKDTESTFVRSMLDEFGLVEQWEVSETSEGGHIKAQAVFREEPQAHNAAAALDRKRLPFSKSRRLFAAVVTSVKFEVLCCVYGVVQNQIDGRKKSWGENNIYFAASPPWGSYLTLQLKGNDRKPMVKAKQELDLILAGEVMRQDGKNIWHPSFTKDGATYEMIKTIEKDLDVVIIRDAWLPQFRVFGTEGRQTQAAKALDRLVKDTSSAPHFIRLDQKDELRWAVEGGLEELQSQLREDKITFDESSRSIVIHGSENDFAEAKLIIARGQSGPSSDWFKSKRYCQICLCEAEEPVLTSCHHTYCGDCFINMCQAKATNPSQVRVTCEGESGQCGHIFELSEVYSILPSEIFENVLEASFTSFVQSNSEQFRYCPTPDCSQVYRAASEAEELPRTFTCNKCLTYICTACHAGHPALTCAEHQDHSSGGVQALNTLKKELGIQDCPRCGTSLEKTTGCNHMTCKGCKAHICWICMATFELGSVCYQHVLAAHRGSEYD